MTPRSSCAELDRRGDSAVFGFSQTMATDGEWRIYYGWIEEEEEEEEEEDGFRWEAGRNTRERRTGA